MTACNDFCDLLISSPSHTSTLPWALTGLTRGIFSPSLDFIWMKRKLQINTKEISTNNIQEWRIARFVKVNFNDIWCDYNNKIMTGLNFADIDNHTARILSYSFPWNSTSLIFSNTPSRWAWIVWESLAWPSISSKAGSDTKKNRGNIRRLASRYPAEDRWCHQRWRRQC